MKTEYQTEYQTEYSRSITFTHGKVVVRQDVNAANLQITAPRISWSSPFKPTLEECGWHLEAIAEAIEIANCWDLDTGKNYKDVFTNEQMIVERLR